MVLTDYTKLKNSCKDPPGKFNLQSAEMALMSHCTQVKIPDPHEIINWIMGSQRLCSKIQKLGSGIIQKPWYSLIIAPLWNPASALQIHTNLVCLNKYWFCFPLSVAWGSYHQRTNQDTRHHRKPYLRLTMVSKPNVRFIYPNYCYWSCLHADNRINLPNCSITASACQA